MSAVPVRCLLKTAPANIQCVPGQTDHVEGIHHEDRLGKLLGGGAFETGEAVHGHYFKTVLPCLRMLLQLRGKDLLGTALDHVQQSRGARLVADRGQIDDDGDVLFAVAGVPPNMLINTNDFHTVEAVRVIDQHPLAFCQDSIVRGIPRDSKALSHVGDGELLAHDAFQRLGQPAAGELHSRIGCLGSVLPPNMSALGAAVAADTDQQNGGSPAEGVMAQPAGHGIAWNALGTALPAPFIRLDHPAGKNGTVWAKTFPGDFQAKAVKTAGNGQDWAVEGSVVHEGRVEEGSDLDNPILSQGPQLALDQLNELQLTMLRRPLHPESGRAAY